MLRADASRVRLPAGEAALSLDAAGTGESSRLPMRLLPVAAPGGIGRVRARDAVGARS
jgi:hypothetical protein